MQSPVALRVNAPIFVEESILEKERTERDELDEWLKNLKPRISGNVM